jgi:hypothetical protein
MVETASQRGVRDAADEQRQPEQDGAVGEHGGGGRRRRGAVDDQRADQAAVDAPTPPGIGSRPPSRPIR